MRLPLPGPEVLQELRHTELLEPWLRRRIEQLLHLPAATASLAHHWFGEAAISLFVARARQLDQVRFSLLRLHDGDLAQEFYFRLQAAETDFPTLLEQLPATQARSQRSTHYGPLPLGELHPRIAERLHLSRVGVLHPPFALEGSEIAILRLEERRHAQLDAATQEKLEQHLLQDWLSSTARQLLPPLTPGPAPTELQLPLPGPLPEPPP